MIMQIEGFGEDLIGIGIVVERMAEDWALHQCHM